MNELSNPASKKLTRRRRSNKQNSDNLNVFNLAPLFFWLNLRNGLTLKEE